MRRLPAVGSSPHVRGTPAGMPHDSRATRFIPARAGNASESVAPGAAVAVHPRTCGERGRAGTGRALAPRFIPARAGNAAVRYSRPKPTPVHPRTCGERLPLRDAGQRDRGSSPHVRGTPSRRGPKTRGCRFIPARAGNAGDGAGRAAAAPVHPRTCGERNHPRQRVRRITGSSPHVRGTLVRRFALRPERRFIPARAGNARTRPAAPAMRPVHPRTCGERGKSAGLSGIAPGSSPHVRGTRSRSPGRHPGRRFIPARAGNAAGPNAW